MDQNQPAPMGQYQPVTDTDHVKTTAESTTALMTSYPIPAVMAAPPTGQVLIVPLVSAAMGHCYMGQLLQPPKDSREFLSAQIEDSLCAIRVAVNKDPRDISVIKIID